MDEDTGLLRASVAYPFRGGATGTRLLFGAGLHLLAGVVAVGGAAAATVTFGSPELAPVWLAVGAVGLLAYVPLLGYTAATVRELLDDEPAPPGFGDPGALLRDGRRFAVVALLYAAPLAALAGLAVSLGPGGDAALAVTAAAGLYALGAAYVLPAAAVTVVESGRTAAAWDPGTLRAAVVDRRYLGRWLLAVAVAAVGGGLGAALAPVVVGFVVLFAAQLAAVRAVTEGVVLSLDLTLEGPPPAPASGYVPGWEDGPRRKELSDGRLGGSLLPTRAGSDGDADIDRSGGGDGGVVESSPEEGATPTADVPALNSDDEPAGDAGSADDSDASGEAGTSIMPTGDGDERDIEGYDG